MERIAPRYCLEMQDYIISKVGQSRFEAQRRRPGKLERLSTLQFQELSTDVYDELNRRLNPNESMPFLPVRDHYHPKRNQARQKLATLSESKFVDLVSDVHTELIRRYPQNTQSAPSRPYPNTSSVQGSFYSLPQQNGSTTSFTNPQQYYTNRAASPSVAPYNRQDSHDRGIKGRAGSNGRNPNESTEYLQNYPARSISDASSRSNQHLEEIEKIRNEYEMKLSAMRKRIGQLEGDMMNMRVGKNEEAGEEVNRLENLNSKLNLRIEKLDSDLSRVRSQNEQLRSKVESLTEENLKLMNNNGDLSTKLKEAKSKIRKLQARSVYARDHEDKELAEQPKMPNSEGAIKPSTITSYQQAIDGLLLAARSQESTSEISNYMDMIRSSCNQFNADVNKYLSNNARDPRSYPLDSSIKDNQLPDILNQLDSRLDGLRNSVDSHINSMGISPISLLESTASHLTTTIVALAKLVGVGKPTDDGDGASQNGQDEATENEEARKLIWLKDYLDDKTDRMIHGIQDMLSLLRTELNSEKLFYTLDDVIKTTDMTVNACRPIFTEARDNANMIPKSFTYFESEHSVKVLDMMTTTHLKLADLKNDIDDALALTGNNSLHDPIVIEFMDDITFKRNLTDALFDLARVNKQLVQLFE
ncbi:component of the polarisome [Mycoemilia scoparia]|uniref:Component of the polarisome n=1 Tax=Mycoemilia scoparia TaxID=417184 RepID=A0A9W8DX02_9FUNG|nr:component of the polarisome [Mycoemilia scoparia]